MSEDVTGGSVAVPAAEPAAVDTSLIGTWRSLAFKFRGGPLVYRRFVSETRDLKLGTVTPVYNNVLIALTLISATGSVESGTMTFRIRVSDMPEFPPDRRSRITYRGHDWLIQEYMTDQAQKVVDLKCVRP